MSLALALPAFAAPVTLDTHENTDKITLSDVTSESSVMVNSEFFWDQANTLYTVPVGSSIDIADYDYAYANYCHASGDGYYVDYDYAFTTENPEVKFPYVLDETYAGAILYVNVLSGESYTSYTFMVKVEGSSAAEQPEQPTTPAEPEQPTTPAQPEQPAQKPGSAVAAPTNDKLTMDGVLQNPTVLKLDGGDNYFKIRDLAAMLNGTGKQFSVGYDGSVQVTTGQAYTPVGGELAGPATATEIAEPSTDVIYINGEKANLTAFKVGGNNFFRLRDLGKALDFYVGWTAGRGVFIETDKPYVD